MSYISWDEYYNIANEVYKELGTINVPVNFEFKGYSIGNWLSRQRGIERKSGLKPLRKQKLEKIGIEWDGHLIKSENHHQNFLKMFALLEAYKKQFGNTRVPRNYTSNGYNLGNWASSIREALRGKGHRKITSEQKAMLEEIGFETHWYQEGIDDSWNSYFLLVVEYAALYGIDEIVQNTIYKNKNIGNWIHVQRGSYKNDTLSAERYEKLIEIGLDFAPTSNRWEKAYSFAEEYYKEFHNLLVPTDFILHGFNLGRWISNQRQVFKGTRTDMALSTIQIQRLEAIGMIWEPVSGSNTSFLEQAFLFYIKKIYPDTVARDRSHGIELDVFVPSISFAIEYDGSHWHKGKLKKDNEKDTICTDLGIRLVRIRECPLPNTVSAICYSTVSHHNNDTLKLLIKKVIEEQFGVSLDIDIARDAFDIIKEFEVCSNNSWHRFFLEAQAYYSDHGNLMIPASYISPNGLKLGVWIQNQRSAYKRTSFYHLSVKEVEMLEAIGMIWDIREHIWEQNFRVAQSYFEKHGNLLVPRECEYLGFKLGKWINSQRNAYKMVGRRKMSFERIKRLEAIGMVWNVRN